LAGVVIGAPHDRGKILPSIDRRQQHDGVGYEGDEERDEHPGHERSCSTALQLHTGERERRECDERADYQEG